MFIFDQTFIFCLNLLKKNRFIFVMIIKAAVNFIFLRKIKLMITNLIIITIDEKIKMI